jgi:predicted RNA-binding Zn ribbon-like protein
MSEQHVAPPEPDRDTELFIEFVNTGQLSGGKPSESLPDGAALCAWLGEHELCGARASAAAGERALPDFRRLRTVVNEVTERLADGKEPSRAQVRAINDFLREGMHYHELRPSDDGAHYTVGHAGDDFAQARASIAGSLAHYIADHDLRRVRICANDGCRWRFIDRSPAGRRVWCDMRTCGNRAKVARHRARKSAGGRVPESARSG